MNSKDTRRIVATFINIPYPDSITGNLAQIAVGLLSLEVISFLPNLEE